MEFRIEEFDLGDGELEAFYVEDPHVDVSAMAIQKGVAEQAFRARCLEGYGYTIRPPRKGHKVCYTPVDMEDLDPVSIRSIQRVVYDLAPFEVAEIKDALKMSGDSRWIASYCHIDIHVVIAVLNNLKQDGFEIESD